MVLIFIRHWPSCLYGGLSVRNWRGHYYQAGFGFVGPYACGKRQLFIPAVRFWQLTAFSVGRTFLEGNRAIDVVRGTPLAAGAGIGGVAGQFLFYQIAGTASDTDALGMVQTGILFLSPLGRWFTHYLSIR